MIRNFLYVMRIGLLLTSSSHSKTKFSEIKKALKEDKSARKINEWSIVEIFPEDFESAY